MKKIALIILLLTTSYLYAQQPSPVIIGNDTVFWIHAKVATYSPKERAEAINKRLNSIIESKEDFNPDSLHIAYTQYGPIIEYRKIGIILLTPNDTIGSQLTLEKLAESLQHKIAQSVEKKQENWAFKNRLKKIGFGVLALFLFILSVNLLNRASRWIKNKTENWKNKQISNPDYTSLAVLNSDRFSVFIGFILKSVRLLIIIVLTYSILPVLFGIFPQTEQWAELLISYTLSPLKSIAESFLNYIPNLFRIVIIFWLTHYIARGLKFLASEIETGKIKLNGFYPDWAKSTFNIIRFLLYAFMFIVIWPYLPGSDSPAFRGVSVFLGVLISFGSSSAISNGVAGLVITYMRPFKIGDRVQIGDVKGDVIEKSMLVTRILTIKNEEITIPNSSILSSYSINYSNQAKELGLILHTSVTIGYDTPWRKVHELLIQAALKTDKIETVPKPFVLQISLNDFYIEYQINAYTHHARGMASIYSDLHQHIQDCFNEAGVEIMSAHYSNIRNGNTTTIPETYRPSDYKSDSFPFKKME